VEPSKQAELKALIESSKSSLPSMTTISGGFRQPSSVPERRLAQLLRERWKNCRVPQGQSQAWPQSSFDINRDEHSFLVDANDSTPLAQHTNRRWLAVAADLGYMHVLELQGYGQEFRVYGPLPITLQCPGD
jgi:hypothetical protein